MPRKTPDYFFKRGVNTGRECLECGKKTYDTRLADQESWFCSRKCMLKWEVRNG